MLHRSGNSQKSPRPRWQHLAIWELRLERIGRAFVGLEHTYRAGWKAAERARVDLGLRQGQSKGEEGDGGCVSHFGAVG